MLNSSAVGKPCQSVSAHFNLLSPVTGGLLYPSAAGVGGVVAGRAKAPKPGSVTDRKSASNSLIQKYKKYKIDHSNYIEIKENASSFSFFYGPIDSSFSSKIWQN